MLCTFHYLQQTTHGKGCFIHEMKWSHTIMQNYSSCFLFVKCSYSRQKNTVFFICCRLYQFKLFKLLQVCYLYVYIFIFVNIISVENKCHPNSRINHQLLLPHFPNQRSICDLLLDAAGCFTSQNTLSLAKNHPHQDRQELFTSSTVKLDSVYTLLNLCGQLLQ